MGFAVGMIFLLLQQTRLSKRIKLLLRELQLNASEIALAPISQLSLAIARQQQVQAQLEHQLQAYKQILDLSPVGFLEVDDENRLLWCNQQAQCLLCINPDQLSPYPRLLLEIVRSYELDQLIEETRTTQEPCQRDWMFYPVSTDPLQYTQYPPYALRGLGLPLSKDTVAVFLESRQEALQLIQQRDRWASDVAHELKTPLTSIRLVAETLYNRLDPALQGWVERLINETVRLSNLVQDLLDLGQMDRGAARLLRLTMVNLPELIQGAWLSLEPLARKKQVQLRYEGIEQLVIEVDEARLYRVLINLFDNAIKYSPPWQVIQVKTSLEKPPDRPTVDVPYVCLEVIDQGPGFPPDALPYVFDRFYRADPARSQTLSTNIDLFINSSGQAEGRANPRMEGNNEGTASPPYPAEALHRSSGLGLAIVKQIVEVHGGSVRASNHPETGGGWLKVWIPQHHDSSYSKT